MTWDFGDQARKPGRIVGALPGPDPSAMFKVTITVTSISPTSVTLQNQLGQSLNLALGDSVTYMGTGVPALP
jgi:hypothetical protein